MAKKKQVEETGTETKAAAEAKETKARKSAVVYIHVGKPGEKDKSIAKQAQQILDLLEAAPGKKMTREALLAAMNGVVQTRQPMERILSYYQSRLIAAGFLRMEEPAAEQKQAA